VKKQEWGYIVSSLMKGGSKGSDKLYNRRFWITFAFR